MTDTANTPPPKPTLSDLKQGLVSYAGALASFMNETASAMHGLSDLNVALLSALQDQTPIDLDQLTDRLNLAATRVERSDAAYRILGQAWQDVMEKALNQP